MRMRVLIGNCLECLDWDMFHFFVIPEPVRQLFLFFDQFDDLKFIRFIMEVGVHQVDVVLGINNVIKKFISQVFCETRQFLTIFNLYLLYEHLMIASIMKATITGIELSFYNCLSFYWIIKYEVQPTVDC